MQTQHVLGADGEVGDGVYVQIRRVGGQHGTRTGVDIDFSEHLLLDGQVFKHGFNHQIGTGQIGPFKTGRQAGFCSGGDGCLHFSGGNTPLVMLGHPLLAALQGGSVLLQQDHLQTGIQRTNGNACSHGAGTNDGDRGHRAGLGLKCSRQFAGFALSKKLVAQGLGLGAGLQLQKQLTLAAQALVKIARCSGQRIQLGGIGALKALARRELVLLGIDKLLHLRTVEQAVTGPGQGCAQAGQLAGALQGG
jgi:hypothetical protein